MDVYGGRGLWLSREGGYLVYRLVLFRVVVNSGSRGVGHH